MKYDLAKTVYAVVYGNYEPPEILGLFEDYDTALAESLENPNWTVRAMDLILHRTKVDSGMPADSRTTDGSAPQKIDE